MNGDVLDSNVEALSLTDAQLAQLARNGVEASWASEPRKRELLEAIDLWESAE